MVAMALPLEAVEAGARLLKQGLEWAEGGLLALAEALPTARESLAWLQRQVSTLAVAIETLQGAIGRALDRAMDNPIGQGLQDFSAWVLDHMPFGLGERISQVLDGLVTVITGVDEMVEGINTHLLDPLDRKWFSASEDEGLNASLVNPLITRVLDPLEAHLEDLSTLADTWQAKLMAPADEALAERAMIRSKISRYKTDHNIG
jgi:enoyl reductase-like protein